MLNIRKECFAFISHKHLLNSPTLKLLLVLKQKLNILCINERILKALALSLTKVYKESIVQEREISTLNMKDQSSS